MAKSYRELQVSMVLRGNIFGTDKADCGGGPVVTEDPSALHCCFFLGVKKFEKEIIALHYQQRDIALHHKDKKDCGESGY